MEIIRYEIDGCIYRVYVLEVLGEIVRVAEHNLDKLILKKIEQGKYNEVRWIDETYGYALDEDVVDTDENEIRAYVEKLIKDNE